uniref:DNA-directed RNA polymerase RpoA/D/Rpb3-type domain-containing protein n=1 Tax=Chromera velia CCMP2878 TaxID=1169474 RepID=A0A0G4H4D4_9ALVE|eukprot:Cvel_24657.t1-p1 / transcript=Cvel_24657.t1 / gene=Cvel_24657 / organism=Chromera_velia_CCMP2878 / gene_product=DNA-directed RNA polymerases I and III subunit, putative / transcript_product=DNA-directed RNA polymerases I and III subunit, putative / location=Cvel_scaffold2695:17449-24030(-) / protein_length=405 / sequence_SO=supercontig / SO=protein_coding / is_pseudo=false
MPVKVKKEEETGLPKLEETAPSSSSAAGAERDAPKDQVSSELDPCGILHGFQLKFPDNCISDNGLTLSFEIRGVHVGVVNALRRAIIAEVPTVMVDTIHIFQNTSDFSDWKINHRVALTPLVIDPDNLEHWYYKNTEPELKVYTEKNGVNFRLHVVGTEDMRKVYSRDLKWAPRTNAERQKWKRDPPRVANPDILLAVLFKGQEIDLHAIATKGKGKMHTKWSPVGTASYQMMPDISFPRGSFFPEKMAEDLVKCCPTGVFELGEEHSAEGGGRKKGKTKVKAEERQKTTATHSAAAGATESAEEEDIEDFGGLRLREVKVRDPYKCTSCKNCTEEYPNHVKLKKVTDRFKFTVESVGSLPVDRIVKDGLRVLWQKNDDVLQDVIGLDKAKYDKTLCHVKKRDED